MGAGQRIDGQAQPCSVCCREWSLRYSERGPHLVWVDAETAAISLLWREPAIRPDPYAGLRREIGPEHRIIDSEWRCRQRVDQGMVDGEQSCRQRVEQRVDRGGDAECAHLWLQWYHPAKAGSGIKGLQIGSERLKRSVEYWSWKHNPPSRVSD